MLLVNLKIWGDSMKLWEILPSSSTFAYTVSNKTSSYTSLYAVATKISGVEIMLVGLFIEET